MKNNQIYFKHYMSWKDLIRVLFILYMLFYFSGLGVYKILSFGIIGVNINYFLLALIFIIVLLQLLKDSNKGKIYLENGTYVIWYGCIFIYCLISLSWSINKSYDIPVGMLFTFFFVFGIAWYVDNEIDFTYLLKIYLVTLSITALRLFLYVPLVFYGRNIARLYIIEIFLVNPNQLANRAVYGLFFALYLYLKVKKPIYIVFMAISLYIILFTGSRNALLLTFIGSLISYILFQGIKKAYKSILMTCLIVTLFMWYIHSDLAGGDKLNALVYSFLGYAVEDHSINERQFFLSEASNMFRRKPVMGWGIGAFGMYLIESGSFATLTNAHNNYMELLACYGIIGFLLFHLFHTKILIGAVKNVRTGNYQYSFSVTCVLLILIGGYASVTYYNIESLLFIFSAYYAMNNISTGDERYIMRVDNEKHY